MSSVPSAVTAGMQKLADVMDFRRRMDGFIIVFQKLGQIVTGKVSLRVKVVQPQANAQPGLSEAPGWTDGETVYLNELVMQRDLNLRGDDALRSLMALKGVTLHEMAHVMVSPRAQDDVCQRVIKRGQKEHDFMYWHAFNILEDQRAETWFVAKYSNTRRFFEAATLRWLVKNPQTMGESYVLVYGRKFLNPRIRVKARAAFVAKYSETLARQFEAVIDEYLTVMFPTETTRAYGLIVKFRELLRVVQRLGQPIDPGHGQGDPGNLHDPDRNDVRREGRPQKQDRKDQQRVRDLIDQAKAEDQAEAEAQQGSPQDPDQKPTTEEGEGPGAGDPGDGSEAAQDPTGASGGQGDEDGEDDASGTGDGAKGEDEGQGSGGATEGEDGDLPEPDPNNICGGEFRPAGGVNTKQGNDIHNHQGKSPMEDLLDDINDQLDKMLDDPNAKKDVQDLQRAIQAAQQNGAGQVQGRDTRFNVKPVPGPIKATNRRLVQIMKEIKLELEGQWEDGQNAGVLNAQRAMLRKPWELDVFDLWTESHEEEGGVEAVILLDMSQSMEHIIDRASQALWATKRAFDELDIPTTVIGYSDSHIILMRATDKSQGDKYHSYPVYSATNPLSAMKEALHIYSKSRYPNRILITITDGNWNAPGGINDDRKKAELAAIMRSMKNQSVTTMLLGIKAPYGGPGPVERYGKHHHELGRDIDNITQLPTIAEHLVSEIMRQVKARV